MDLGLAQKTALVTGSSRGLGRSVAESLARAGAQTFVCARSRSDLQTAATQIAETTGTPVEGIPVDLADPISVNHLASQVLERVERVDVLVHVAGGPDLGRFVEKDRAEWDEQFQVHFHSFRQLTQRLLPGMVAGGWGRVIAVTSRTVKRPRVDNVLSGAVRLPTISVLRVLADEYGPQGLTFNAVCPGPFATDRLMAVCEEKARDEGTSVDDQVSVFAEGVAVGRVGRPEELGSACTFLASDAASFVNGHVLMVDGGSVRTIF